MPLFKKVWHPYTSWEEYHAGMWRRIYGREREIFLQKSIEFTGNPDLYGQWMISVIESWPISCEHNLTDYGTNRRAWIGHAACCLAIQCPEDITREAWGFLSEDQRAKANHKADLAILAWERDYSKKQDSKVYLNLGDSWLS